jgi:cytoskeletal protein RodZ
VTARHQIRIGSQRLIRDRAIIQATPAPTTGDMLQAARDKKGVDLFRAERDTKIRAKYLAALEQGDPNGLPSPVYTKGFLRNYALYLRLDPDEVLARWKSETVALRQPKPVLLGPPQPIRAPRRGLMVTPGLFVGLLLTLAILAFGAYVGIQVFRFSQPPQLVMTSQEASLITVDSDHYTLAGTATPGSTIAIQAAASQVYRVTADATGKWQKDIPLTKGQNDFHILATDPETGNASKPIDLIITVPFPTPMLAPAGATQAPGAAGRQPSTTVPVTLAVTQPLEGAAYDNGTVAIMGTTNGTGVTVTASAVPASGAAPSRAPDPSAIARASTPPATGPSPAQMMLFGANYSGTLSLPSGTWRLDITSSGAGMASTTESRTVSVAFSGLTVVVEAKKGQAWIKVWSDGRLVDGYIAGKILQKGTSATFTADRTITVRTGNAGATLFSVNGVSKGILGPPGHVETYLFQVGHEPIRTASQ